MKVTIELEELKEYIKTLHVHYDEWWAPVYNLETDGIVNYFAQTGRKKDKAFAKELDTFLEEWPKVGAKEKEKKEEEEAERRWNEYIKNKEVIPTTKFGDAPVKIEGEMYSTGAKE